MARKAFTQTSPNNQHAIIQGLSQENQKLKQIVTAMEQQLENAINEGQHLLNQNRTLIARNKLFDAGLQLMAACITAGSQSSDEVLAVEAMNSAKVFCAEFDAHIKGAQEEAKAAMEAAEKEEDTPEVNPAAEGAD